MLLPRQEPELDEGLSGRFLLRGPLHTGRSDSMDLAVN